MSNQTKSTVTEQTFDIIYRLINDFDKFGHLYDTDGRLKDLYRHNCYDENGVLVDGFNMQPVTCNPFSEYNLKCSYNEDDSKDVILPWYVDSGFSQQYRALNVHNGNSNEFRNLKWADVMSMSVQDICNDYLTAEIMDQLIAMLRFGRNYATVEPVSYMISDSYLCEHIALVWKSILLGTISARDLANALTFGLIDRADDLSGADPDIRILKYNSMDSFFGINLVTYYPIAFGGSFQRERYKATEALTAEREKELENIIELGIDPADRAVLRQIQAAVNEAFGNSGSGSSGSGVSDSGSDTSDSGGSDNR